MEIHIDALRRSDDIPKALAAVQEYDDIHFEYQPNVEKAKKDIKLALSPIYED